MTCQDCIHRVRDWRICLHPMSQTPGFWADAEDYSCRTLEHVPETNFGQTNGPDERPQQMELIP